MPRPARTEWFNLQLLFSTYSTDVAQRIGWKSSGVAPSDGALGGQEGVRMLALDAPDACKELKQLLSGPETERV